MAYDVLKGIRVVDLGIITAGSSTSAILADLGAEVIKVEGPAYVDPLRSWLGRESGADWWNRSPLFAATNRRKKSVCIDLKMAAGRELFLELVGRSDIVVENFSAAVLDKLGIGYSELSKANPGIILASISSQGKRGPNATEVSFGSTLEASSGFSSFLRYPGEQPQITGRGLNYPDQVSSLFAAGAVMTALVDRLRSGRGAHIDLSQRELTSFLIGEAILAALDGNQATSYPAAPNVVVEGVFGAADRQYVAVTISGAAAECGRALLCSDIDEKSVAAWIGGRDAFDAAKILRQAGIAAEIVVAAAGYADPAPLPVDDAYGFDSQGRWVKGLPLELGTSRSGEMEAAPSLGFHNHEVMVDQLGLSEDSYAELVDLGVLADRPKGEAA